MSVITIADLERDASAGYEDPSLPIGIWRSSQVSTGDASGGTNVLQFQMKAAGVKVGNLWSLEEIYTDDQDATNLTFAMCSLAGFEGWTPSFDVRNFTVPLNVPGGQSDLIGGVVRPQLFMGRAAGDPAGTLSVIFPNDDGSDVVVSVTGYMWQPRSLLAPGGPSRPLQGRFPN